MESYATLVNGNEIGVQAKWFPNSITTSQFKKIKDSILTALEVHTKLIKYVVCVPRDLSNSKKGKKGKLVQETEYSKWDKIVTDVKSKYPNVDVIFWGDHYLEKQLQYAEAAGVRRYWFEKEELTLESIQYSFEKQKSGWMAQRYISVLHSQGMIHKEIISFLGDSQECNSLLRELEYIEDKYKLLINEINTLCEFLYEKELCTEKITELEELNSKVKKQVVELSEVEFDFRYENRLKEWKEYVLTYEKMNDIEVWLEEYSNYGDHYNHFYDVKKLLKKIRNINMYHLFENLKKRIDFNKIIVVGDPGTGKTHGIANEVEVQLKEHYNIPILIQGKSVLPQDEWKDIVIRVMGLSQDWSEEELWTALEALSYRNELNCPLCGLADRNFRIIPKVIICIDGIDEIKPYLRWNERINQVDAIVSRHPRIRFCFTGRRYAFNFGEIVSTAYKKITLFDDGDVPVKTIYDDYIRHYNIDDEGVKWLRHSLSTPFALKLLCELYEGKSIGKIGKSDIIVSNLLQRKFDKLNQEFKVSAGFEENINDQIVKAVLIKINEIFEFPSARFNPPPLGGQALASFK